MVDKEDTPEEFPFELAKQAGLFDTPETSPYFTRDGLETREKVELLAGCGLLTERQAEAYVHREIEETPREEAADKMGIGTSALDDYRAAARDKINKAHLTTGVVDVLDGG